MKLLKEINGQKRKKGFPGKDCIFSVFSMQITVIVEFIIKIINWMIFIF
jgi:hypothetical protein